MTCNGGPEVSTRVLNYNIDTEMNKQYAEKVPTCACLVDNTNLRFHTMISSIDSLKHLHILFIRHNIDIKIGEL